MYPRKERDKRASCFKNRKPFIVPHARIIYPFAQTHSKDITNIILASLRSIGLSTYVSPSIHSIHYLSPLFILT